jgi:CheY-like chemotaxis protein
MMADRRKILVVDDEPDIVTYLVSLFEDNGYIAISARDGDEGMEKVRSEKPDLITLDISMPNKSGVRLYREIKSDPELKAVPIVIVTGVSSTHDGGSGEDFKRFLGTRKQVPAPEAFVMKPVVEAELLGAVEEHLQS